MLLLKYFSLLDQTLDARVPLLVLADDLFLTIFVDKATSVFRVLLSQIRARPGLGKDESLALRRFLVFVELLFVVTFAIKLHQALIPIGRVKRYEITRLRISTTLAELGGRTTRPPLDALFSQACIATEAFLAEW